MEIFSYDEIMSKAEDYFKNLGYEPQFTEEGNDYKNVIVFRVMDKNKKVVIPQQKIPISRLSNKADMENYLQEVKAHYKLP